MSEIICPHCNRAFTIDESDYAKLIAQVRTAEFDKEIHEKLQAQSDKQKASYDLDKQDIRMKHQADIAEKDKLIESLKSQLEKAQTEKQLAVTQAVTEKDNEISDLKSQIKTAESEKEIAVNLAVKGKNEEINKKNEEIARLQTEIENKSTEKQLAVTQAVTEKDNEISDLRSRIKSAESEKEIAVNNAVKNKDDEISKKNQEIIELKSQINSKETEKQLAISQLEQKKDSEIASKNAEIQTLNSTIELKESERKASEQIIKSNYEEQLKMKDEQIEKYKDFKQRLSTKMVGETLEQHCSIQFNQFRMTAFPNAYFEKDNDSSSGSKGDFIYKDFSDDGTEYISIMFEMKNESDTTATKHKNEDFFKELDKDRNEKKCEYAVLVSMLESDNELYNNGIVDVSYRYPKMYVIRPQFFIPLITLLRNAALNSLEYRKQLMIVQNQQADLTTFESNLETFKNSFLYTYENATKKHKEAVEGIDKAIAQLTKIKEALQASDKHLNAANNKISSDLTIKRLTKNADSVYEKLIEIKNADNK